MTKHSLLLRTAVVLICLFWPALSYGWVTYTGTSFVLQTSGGVSTGSVSVADSGFVASVTVNVNMTALWSGLPDISLNLVSPAGDSVALFNIDKLEGKSLHNTTFDDAAAKKIVDGDPPYIGPHSPMQSLNIFGGTELSGNWTLVAYQHDDFNPGMVESWSFSVQTEAVPAPTPPDYGREFVGPPFSLPDTRGTTTSSFFISPDGQIERLSFQINLVTQGDLEDHSISLRSPTGTTVNLFEREQLYGTNLYQTFFSDLARQWIYDGQPAYSGSYRPTGLFANFNGQWSSGTWTLLVYNDSNDAPGEVTDWSVFIHPDPGTTPTPSPTPDITPTPAPFYEGDLIKWLPWLEGDERYTDGTYLGYAVVPDADDESIDKVRVRVTGSVTEDLYHIGMYLISPEPYEVEVALFEKYDIDEHGMYRTMFDDTAERPITQGKAPYIGRYKPVEQLSKFNGKWSAGTWTLAVYNDHQFQGGEFEWRLYINEPDPTPTPTPEPGPTVPPLVCQDFTIDDFTFSGVGVTERTFNVPNAGTLYDANLHLNLSASADLESIRLSLRSPEQTVRNLCLVGTLSGYALHSTIFDDAAAVPINTGIPPYLGPHRPVQQLSDFNEKPITGNWTFILYNQDPANSGEITGLRLTLCYDPLPTPTPTPTPTATPLPTATPVPTVTPGPDYPGEPISWTSESGPGTYTGGVYIPQSGAVSSVRIRVDEGFVSEDLGNIGMFLISPQGTEIALFEKYDIDEHGMYRTLFDDTADQPITAGRAPYMGHWRPVEELAGFIGEPMEGYWTLAVYTDTAQDGEFHWTLFVNEPPPPPSPTPVPGLVCAEFEFDDLEFDGTGTSEIVFSVPVHGILQKTTLHLNLAADQEIDAIRLNLRSPAGTYVDLSRLGDLEGFSLFSTIFDDTAALRIDNGTSPYLGPHRPREQLSTLNGQAITGEWSFTVYRDSPVSGEITGLRLTLCYDPMPSPTPTSTPSPTVTPSITPIPTTTPETTPSPTPPPKFPGDRIWWPIPDEGEDSSGTYTGVADIPVGLGSVKRVRVRIDEGSVSEDLYDIGMYLISPNGTQVALFEKYDIDEHGMYLTIFDDAAERCITEGKAPYVGGFKPVEKLDQFYEEPAGGAWTLAVYNDNGSQGGEFFWTLLIDFYPPPEETWYLAAGGTKIEDFDFSHYVLIANPGERDANVLVECVDETGVIADLQLVAKARSRRTVNINNLVGNNQPAVSVIVTSNNRVPIYCERASYWSPGGFHWAGSHASSGIYETARNWYLTEGATHLFDQYIHILNPNTVTAQIEVTFTNQDGATWSTTTSVLAKANRTIKVNDVTGSQPQISTRVKSKNAVPVAVERTMYWDSDGIQWIDGHASRGVSEADLFWYLAEGATHIFDEYILIFNPDNSRTAQIKLSLLENGIVGNSHVLFVNPMSRKTINARDLAGLKPQLAAIVESLNSVPIIVERAMYWTADGISWAGGHAAVASSRRSDRWFIPEGATHIFDHYIQVLNPETAKNANIRFTFLLPDGSTIAGFGDIPPLTRYTINARDYVGDANQVATVVESLNSAQLVVERATYHPRDEWRTGHATGGISLRGVIEPEPPSWYELYGPEGEDKVIIIDNMFVAKWTDNPGTDFEAEKNWQAARSYALGLDWLDKSDWRIPNREELRTILQNQHLLGQSSQGWHWSADERDGATAWVVSADGYTTTWGIKSTPLYFRVVRDID